MSTTTVKTRFCPSPTGYVHLGNMRTALFSALYARHCDGDFLLRIEDTDQARSHEEYTQQLQADLRWLGLDWQEGPEVEGDNGPYWQSQRQAIYDSYYQTLIDKDFAYPCFCTEQQLALTRKVQRAAGQPPRYPGTCRNLTDAEVAAKKAEGLKPTLRFKIPKDKQVVFEDAVKGRQQFNCNDLGDLIIRRADGTAPFMYCNAIDDALMGVTHVLRGEDHLTNTPRQILILEALGLPIPEYAHMPLIVGSDGSPLSKRHGSRSVKDLREAGFLPGAITNYLARLGHYYADNDFFTNQQLGKGFDLSNIGSSPARFDLDQLHYWQKEALHQLSDEDFNQWFTSVLAKVPEDKRALFATTIRPNVIFPGDGLAWVEILFEALPTLSEELQAVVTQAGRDYYQGALKAVEQHGVDYQAICQQLKTELGVKGKGLFQPLRVATTGMLHGPEMAQLFQLLGAETIQQRFQQALALCE